MKLYRNTYHHETLFKPEKFQELEKEYFSFNNVQVKPVQLTYLLLFFIALILIFIMIAL